MLETSCLFTEAADKLIKEELSEFILSTVDRAEFNVTWHLPDMVRAERKHQMLIRAERLIPQLEKVESLLGHKFGISKETLDDRVEVVISRETTRHNLQLRSLDVSKVDWNDLISRSVQRRPPFDPGEKEKGFRDAIVLETFGQIIEDLPKSPQSCRLVLMSGDRLLTEAAQERASGRSNITYTGDLEEIQTMLNALASALTQEAVDKILPAASALFWTKDDKSTLYYKETVAAKISEKFPKELAAIPAGFTRSITKQVLIRAPAFLSKANQRLTFSSRVTHEVEATKTVWRPPSALQTTGGLLAGIGVPSTNSAVNSSGSGVTGPSTNAGLFNAGMLGSSFRTTGPSASNITPGIGALAGTSSGGFSLPLASSQHLSNPSPPPSVPEEIRRAGRHVFEVFWSATLMANGTIKNAKIENIEHKISAWEEEL